MRFEKRGELDRRGMGLFSLLIVLVIVGVAAFFYLKNNKQASNSLQKFMKGAKLDTSSLKGLIDNTKKSIDSASSTSFRDALDKDTKSTLDKLGAQGQKSGTQSAQDLMKQFQTQPPKK